MAEIEHLHNTDLVDLLVENTQVVDGFEGIVW